MLIAVCGSQGSGKSTIIQEIKDRGYVTVERKTARSILSERKVTLDEVNADLNIKKKFQEELTKRKRLDEYSTAARRDIIAFCERTHADLFTYALVSLGVYNEHSKWLNWYYQECLRNCQYYDKVFYLRGGLFTIEHDGVRGSNPHYARMVDLTMLDITRQMIHNGRLTIIETPDIERRVNMILNQSLDPF